MYDKYRIKSGDSLASIAEKFETTVDNIIDINNIEDPNTLRSGMDIVVPKKYEEYYKFYTIEHGATLYNIAKKYNINPELLALLNGLDDNDYIYDHQEIIIPQNGYSYYITKDGDTLKTVADRFDTNSSSLLEENKTAYLLGGQLIVHKN